MARKKSEKKHIKKKANILKNITLALSITIIIVSPLAFFYIYFLNRIYPNIYIAETNVSGKTPYEAQKLVNPKTNLPEKLTLNYNNKTFIIKTDTLQLNFNKEKTINRAYILGRTGNIVFDLTQIISLIQGKINYPLELDFNEENLKASIDKIAKEIDIAPTDAKFIMEGNKVKTFSPETGGLKVDKEKLIETITNEIKKNDIEDIAINIPTKVLSPQIKSSDINNLGIKEIIGSGTSRFAGSISSRIFNINLAASRIDGSLIAPGGTFSFNNTVGDISSTSGYQQAYVIQNGQTVLGDGGGVCQVSTTLFRAAMNSGLPIMERHAHAYRVHYYEEDAAPGFDATVYTPSVDFKFQNNTANYILIQTQIDLRNLTLTFNFYGTKDERTIEITKPSLWGASSAPESLYIDDPTLPVGQIKQIDWSAPGLKSQFEYTVLKNGDTINHQFFYSNFQPWQAKFLRGTKTS